VAEARDVAPDAALGYLFDHHVGIDAGPNSSASTSIRTRTSAWRPTC